MPLKAGFFGKKRDIRADLAQETKNYKICGTARGLRASCRMKAADPGIRCGRLAR